MALDKYNRKRDFTKTSEPAGTVARPKRKGREARFVVQEHHARNLHFDLRLEIDGVLKSWAVPKGPSLDPSIRRLAVQTEDHPMKYLTFEGHIPAGNYGAGDMAVWDTGTFTIVEGKWSEGKLHVILNGDKLCGEWILVRLREENQWLFFKAKDDFAEPGWVLKTVINEPASESVDEKKKPVARKRAARIADKKSVIVDPKSVEGAHRAPMLRGVSPMLTTLVDKPPAGDWLYEIKWDGYRAVAFIEDGVATLISRNKIPLAAKFPELAEAFAGLAVKKAVLDGEIVVLDSEGRPRFQLLQNRAGLYSKSRSRKKTKEQEAGDAPAPTLFYAFDLLYLNGYDLKAAPLIDRKTLLRRILEKSRAQTIRYSDHVRGAEAGPELLDHARSLGLEGIVAKRADSQYQERRSEKWQKIKLVQTTDVVIGGYTAPRRTRSHFGALVMGQYQVGELRYVGHTGSGFNEVSLREIFDALQSLRTDKCPFAEEPATNQPVVWVKPKLVCEIKFTEWTGDGSLRHPIFLGLRADKNPQECLLEDPAAHKPARKAPMSKSPSKTTAPAAQAPNETPDDPKAVVMVDAAEVFAAKTLKGNMRVRAGEHVVELTHLDKVYWPDDDFTKGDLLRYYYRMSETILPYLQDRPLILQRFPGGITGQSFHQHNVEHPPAFLDTYLHHEKGESIHYAVCNNLASLLYLANLGSIAQHAWLSTIQQPEKPDWIVFDLDPGEVPFSAVCDLALELRDVLKSLGIESYAKTSGSEGLHVCVPVQPNHTYGDLQVFYELIARTAQANRPAIATLERSISKRPKNSIYLDYMQNHEGKTVVAPWVPRAKPGATVSAPLTWAEVKRVPKMEAHTIVTVPRRIKTHKDPFQGMLTQRQDLTEVLRHIGALTPAPKSTAKKKRAG